MLTGQNANITGVIRGGENLQARGSRFSRLRRRAEVHEHISTTTLWDEFDSAGVVTLVAKSLYPLNVPQRPEDFVPPNADAAPTATDRGSRIGPALRCSANDLAFGYAAAQDGQFVLVGNLYNLSQPTPAAATSVRQQAYVGSLDEEGAKKVAREFAADILAQFGGKSLSGTKIYFVSDRTGPRIMADGTKVGVKEIWSMDYDGSNQRQLTYYKSLSITPTVSADGTMFAFTSYPQLERGGHLVDGNPADHDPFRRTQSEAVVLQSRIFDGRNPRVHTRRQARIVRDQDRQR